jgi:hypothetical protein
VNSTTGGPFTWSDGKLLAQTYGGQAAAYGDIASYNETGSLVWPYMIAWGQNTVGIEPASQLTCIRAKNAVDGSRVPGPNITTADAAEANAANPLNNHDSSHTLALMFILASSYFVFA